MMWLFSSVLLLFPTWCLVPFCKAAFPLRPSGGTWERSDGMHKWVLVCVCVRVCAPAGSLKWWCGLWKKAAFPILTSVIPSIGI